MQATNYTLQVTSDMLQVISCKLQAVLDFLARRVCTEDSDDGEFELAGGELVSSEQALFSSSPPT